MFYFVDGSILHCTKQQWTTALFTIEVEYMTFSKIEKKIILCVKFLKKLDYMKNTKNSSVLLRANNKKSISLIENSEFHKRTKHIDIRWHWIKNAVKRNQVILKYVSIKTMTADGLIKSLSTSTFKDFIEMMKMNIKDRIEKSIEWTFRK